MNLLTKLSKIFPIKSSLGSCGKNSKIQLPTYIATPNCLHMEENTIIRFGACILNNQNENIYIKKYTAIGTNLTIVTQNHRSTVGIPHILLGASHINDTSRDLHIGEDVWIGTNVTLLSGGDLGRGCIVAACSLVNKPVPPYALVAGSPAKIIGVKFTVDQIIEHEKALYPENERMSRDELEMLFAKYYEGKKVFGVQTEFTEKDLKAIEAAKKKRAYIEPVI